MTAQISERLRYEGEEVNLCEQPLASYFARASGHPDFESDCTALWRGYVGTWEILGDRLYLVGLAGTMKDGSPAALETFFPGFPERVFAHWYSGKMRVPSGRLLKYVHMGFASIYEEDLFITVEKGVVVGTSVRRNGVSDNPNAAEGYGIGGMTILPSSRRPAEGGDTR